MPPESHSPHLRTIDEQLNHCFGCGADNPHGLRLHFTLDEPEVNESGKADPLHPIARATVTLTRLHEGPPRHVHGGIIATLLDEGMSKLNRPLGLLAMTRHMEVEYLRPVPLRQPLTVTARHLRRGGRKLFHAADITLAGKVLAQGTGFFLVVDPAHLPPSAQP